MKRTFAVLLVLCLSVFALGQTATPPAANPLNLYGAGVSYNPGASPAVAGTGMYARLLSDGSGTYAFTIADALPNTTKPFTISTNIGVGIAQKIATISGVPVFIPTSAGISYTGTNTGWAWTTGAIVVFNVKGKPGWKVMPNVRLVKSSVSGGTGYQPVIGVLLGWGQ